MLEVVGYTKCQICGELMQVRLTNNKTKTPWVACGRCHNRSFYNGIEGQEIRKHLQEGHKYTTSGGMEFLPMGIPEKAETPASDEDMSDFDLF